MRGMELSYVLITLVIRQVNAFVSSHELYSTKKGKFYCTLDIGLPRTPGLLPPARRIPKEKFAPYPENCGTPSGLDESSAPLKPGLVPRSISCFCFIFKFLF